MGSSTSIEWTDATWNPVTGCREVSEGCDNCYAKTWAERFRGVPGHPFEQGFDVRLWPERLTLPLRWRKPRRVFANSMSDLFISDVGNEFIAKAFAVMIAAPQHNFQILTKRPARMCSLLNREEFWRLVSAELGQLWNTRPPALLRCPPPWIWLGVSAENQRWADIRIPHLLATPCAVHFVSAEPLLGPIRMREHWLADGPRGVKWVIVGGESGAKARPMQPDWARSLREQCQEAEVAFFFKQAGKMLAREWGCSDRKGKNPSDWPETFPREMPGTWPAPESWPAPAVSGGLR